MATVLENMTIREAAHMFYINNYRCSDVITYLCEKWAQSEVTRVVYSFFYK
jgi:hypothetical protein